MKYELKPNQFHPEVYDLTVYVDNLPEINMDAIHHEGDTTYWYGENADGFVRFGISHDVRMLGHEPGYMWSSRASVFNGRFPSKCHCKEVTVVNNGYRYGYLAMTVPALIDLLGDGYELFAFIQDGEYFVEIGEAYQLFTDDQLDGRGELLESFLCGEVK
jgi:hypothetical protein